MTSKKNCKTCLKELSKDIIVKRMGYIRNLFVEVDVLKESFLNVGSLREGIENFFGVMRRNFGPLHDFEVQV